MIGTLNLLAAAGASGSLGAQGGREVLHPRLRCRRPGPDLVPRGGHPNRPGADPARAVAPRGRVAGPGLRRGQPPSRRDRPALRQRARHRHHHARSATTCASRVLPCIAGFDPLVQFVEEDDVVRALEFVTANRVPGVFNVAGEGKLPWSEVASFGGAHLLPFPPFRPRACLPPPSSGSGPSGSRPRWRAWSDSAGASTPRSCERPDSSTATPAPAPCSASPGPTTCAGPPGRPATEYRYEQDVEQFFRHSPSVVRGIDT